MSKIRTCSRCVMNDSSDSFIKFDENGFCNYCSTAIKRLKNEYFPNKLGEQKLNELLERVKKEGKGKKYDCIMGLSGGLDSSYLAMLGYKWGLRVLAVHINDGYDTEISKSNIKKLVEKTGFDYKEIIPDPIQFNALTLSFMKAGVPNIAIPQDNILIAFLYKQMRINKIKYFFCGTNLSLESILQEGNSYKNTDLRNLIDIHKHYYVAPINKLSFISTNRLTIYHRLYHFHRCSPLNYVDYQRDRAFKELNDFCGFEYYGSKHLENIFTAFVQLYWLPKKFNFDKRTSHLSSMIVSGQLSREDALTMLKQPLYDENLMHEYIGVVCEKLGISEEELDQCLHDTPHSHYDFKREDDLLLNRLKDWIITIRNKRISNNQ